MFGPGPSWSKISKIFSVQVRTGPGILKFLGPDRSILVRGSLPYIIRVIFYNMVLCSKMGKYLLGKIQMQNKELGDVPMLTQFLIDDSLFMNHT